MTRRRLLLALAGLLLAVSSALVWQFRFEIAGPAVPLRIDTDARGWLLRAPDLFQIDPETWTLSAADGRIAASAEGLLPGLGLPRYLHVVVDAKWENVTRKDDRSWWSARVTLGGRKPDGSHVWPQDGDLINALGSRDWHRAECVFELPADIGEPRLFINHLAATGSLSVRRLTATPVRQRPWIPVATGGLILGWLAWSGAMLGGDFGLPRRAAASLVLVAAGWFLVFPQPHFHARPFPGGFLLGREIPATPETAKPAPPVLRPLARIEAPPPAGASKPAPTPSESRPDPGLVKLFRKIDREWRFAHVAAFGGVGLALFILVGIRRAWPAAAALALFSEIVPGLLLRDFDTADMVDLATNFAGLGLAALLAMAVARIRQSRGHRES